MTETSERLVTKNGELSASKTPRIVLLEYEGVLSQLFEDLIHDWFEKVDLVKFENGVEALKELARDEPDLLILDWVNPGSTGYGILKLLALDQAKFPILLTSEFFDRNMRLASDHGLKFGFLPKPFEIKDFWAVLNELVGPSDRPELQAIVKEPERHTFAVREGQG
ncbi:MAG: response regulator [Verrucomicrobiota bacterium]